MKIISASAGQVEEIAGFNPENADMGNPEGAYYRRVVRITAETYAGRRFILAQGFTLEEEEYAERIAAKIVKKGEINLEYWEETYEVYGSNAWQEADNGRQREHDMSPLAGTCRDF